MTLISCFFNVLVQGGELVELIPPVKLLLSGHSLLNGHLSNFQKAVPLFTVNLTSIKRSPLLTL